MMILLWLLKLQIVEFLYSIPRLYAVERCVSFPSSMTGPGTVGLRIPDLGASLDSYGGVTESPPTLSPSVTPQCPRGM